MMKSALLAATAISASAIALIASAPVARAADYYGYNKPYTVNQPLNSYSWAGPYLGGNIGYQWGSVGGAPASPSGVAGGIQGGYNYQSGSLVIGLEADIQISDANDRFASYKFSNPWFGTVRGRLGYAMNNILVYATGGLAFGELRLDAPNGSQSYTNTGWTIGAGVEVGIYQNWTAKVEYIYVDLARDNFSLINGNNDYNYGMVRLGVNYHF